MIKHDVGSANPYRADHKPVMDRSNATDCNQDDGKCDYSSGSSGFKDSPANPRHAAHMSVMDCNQDDGKCDYSSESPGFADSPSEEESAIQGDMSSRFVKHMKHQFGEIKNVWSKKVEALKRTLAALKVSGDQQVQDKEIFDIVLCIFSGPSDQASDAIHLLEEAYLVRGTTKYAQNNIKYFLVLDLLIS